MIFSELFYDVSYLAQTIGEQGLLINSVSFGKNFFADVQFEDAR
jgi:hypothetical protein